MIETSVTYVSSQTSVNVLRIDVTVATMSGIADRGQRPEDEEQDDQRADARRSAPRSGRSGRSPPPLDAS